LDMGLDMGMTSESELELDEAKFDLGADLTTGLGAFALMGLGAIVAIGFSALALGAMG